MSIEIFHLHGATLFTCMRPKSASNFLDPLQVKFTNFLLVFFQTPAREKGEVPSNIFQTPSTEKCDVLQVKSTKFLVRKFGSSRCGEVVCVCVCACVCVCVCVCVCIHRVGVCLCVLRVLTKCVRSGLCACTLPAKSGLPTKSRHSTSAVGFGIRFGLVILENPLIDHKILGVVLICLVIEIISRII